MNDFSSIAYRAGDILVSCDNDLAVPQGYLGHSAIAVDPHTMIEAVIDYPFIQHAPIERFMNRPNRVPAVYRPKDPEVGANAARFAIWYYQTAEAYRQQGIICPPFSFSTTVPLADPWTTVYCSKLVWLSYYYGAGIELPNDFFLFTPEDIDTLLSRDARFETVYRHPDFHFVINT